MQTYVACLQYIQSYVYSRVTAKKGTTMLDKELLDSLKAAQEENNQEKFVNLCCTRDVANASEYNNFHSLDVLKSTITENNDTFIEHLKKYMTDEERPLLERFEKTNYHYDFEYYDIDEDNVETARDLYDKYEGELDSMLIWDNAEKIIEDLEDYIDLNEE